MQLHAQIFLKDELHFRAFVIFAEPSWTFEQLVKKTGELLEKALDGWDVLDLKLNKYIPRATVGTFLKDYYGIVLAPPELQLSASSPEKLAELRLSLKNEPPAAVSGASSAASASPYANGSTSPYAGTPESASASLASLSIGPSCYDGLRDYQKDLVDQVGSADADFNCVVCMPTGSGKTEVAMAVAERALLDRPSARVLFIVETNTLSEQQAKRMQQNLRRWRVRGYMAGTKIDWRGQDAMVCTAGVLRNALAEQPPPDGLAHFDLMIIDECHHVKKDHAFHRILQEHYHPLRKAGLRPPRLLGLTATPVKGGATVDQTVADLRGLMHRMRPCRIRSVISEELKAEMRESVPRPAMEKVAIVVDMTAEEVAFQKECSQLIEFLEKRLPDSEDAPDAPPSTEAYAQRAKDMAEMAQKEGSSSAPIWRWLRVVSDAWQLMFDASLADAKEHLAKMLRCMRCALALAPAPELEKVFQSVERITGFEAGTETQSGDDGTWDLAPSPREDAVNQAKLSRLVRALKAKRAAAGDSFRAIVFVEQRYTANAIARRLTSMESWMRAAPLVGQGTGGMTIRQQSEAVERFRDGRLNILVATSVAEEGLDVAACQLVVRFDGALSQQQLVQSRGRARAADSTFLCIFHRGSPAEVAFDRVQERERRMIQAVEKLQEQGEDGGGDEKEEDEGARSPTHMRIADRDEFLRHYSERCASHVRATLGVEIRTIVVQSGPPHQPTFAATATLDGGRLPAGAPRAFEARGGSKREATRAAEARALAALDDAALLTLPPDFRGAAWQPRAARAAAAPDTAAERERWLLTYGWNSLVSSLRIAAGSGSVSADPPGLAKAAWHPSEEYGPGPPFECRLRFPFPASVGPLQEFAGRGPSKPEAKQAAAREACEWLDAQGIFQPNPAVGPNRPPFAPRKRPEPAPPAPLPPRPSAPVLQPSAPSPQPSAPPPAAADGWPAPPPPPTPALLPFLERYGQSCLRLSLAKLGGQPYLPDVQQAGPPHQPRFQATVSLQLPGGGGPLTFRGEGPKRDGANRAAAAAACAALWRRGLLVLDNSIQRCPERAILEGPFQPALAEGLPLPPEG